MKFSPYSVSKLGTYNHCPKQFEFKYVNKVKVPFTMNVALYKGSYIHHLLEHGKIIEVETLEDIPDDMRLEFIFK